jgi:hypothetical protein
VTSSEGPDLLSFSSSLGVELGMKLDSKQGTELGAPLGLKLGPRLGTSTWVARLGHTIGSRQDLEQYSEED